MKRGFFLRRVLRSAIGLSVLAILLTLWLYPEQFGLQASESVSASGEMIKVRDGDTLTIGEQDYRLQGIDAPEFSQICKDEKGADWPCGKLARAEMVGLVHGHSLTCAEHARDKFQRVVATCIDEHGVDISRAMAVAGMAVSFGGFGEGPYAQEELGAKEAKRGIWRGTFETPSSWRHTHPRKHGSDHSNLQQKRKF